MVICQVFGVITGVNANAATREEIVRERCDAIQNQLRIVQRDDARTRIYLGRYYETILTRFITPMNMRLAENTLLDAKFTNNQNYFAKTRENFTIDYTQYQRELEDLTVTDCKKEPELFYKKLEQTREWRKSVEEDAAKLRRLIDENKTLVTSLMERV